MAKSNAEKQRDKRAKKLALGLKKLEVWALPEDHAAIKKLEEKSQKKANKS